MQIALIVKPGHQNTGLGRYASCLKTSLEKLGHQVCVVHPINPFPGWLRRLLKRWFRIDVEEFFNTYPLWARYPKADIYHLTSQTQAILMYFSRPPGKTVVTVHDIFPYLLKDDERFKSFQHPIDACFYQLSLRGLKKAEAIICVSKFTQSNVEQALLVSIEKLHVVYEPVDFTIFKPQRVSESFFQKYSLKQGRSILYVGSQDPRKNLRTLIKAFALVKNQILGAQLWLVGKAHYEKEKKFLIALAQELKVEDSILFFDEISDNDLVNFYNLADMVVMPSLYEGFGLPVLEAMACSRPIVVSNTTSLPEIVGDTALLVNNPLDACEMAERITFLLNNTNLARELGTMAHFRSLQFSFENQAAGTSKVYENVLKQSKKIIL